MSLIKNNSISIVTQVIETIEYSFNLFLVVEQEYDQDRLVNIYFY